MEPNDFALALAVPGGVRERTNERSCVEHKPNLITQKNRPSVVDTSPGNNVVLEETTYLLHSPKNARRLIRAISDLEKE